MVQHVEKINKILVRKDLESRDLEDGKIWGNTNEIGHRERIIDDVDSELCPVVGFGFQSQGSVTV
jgi:hypothetical protein